MMTKQIEWKDKQHIQNTGIEDSQGNITADQRHTLKIFDEYGTELYEWAKQPENLEVEIEEEEAVRWGTMMSVEMYSNCWEKTVWK